MSVLQVCYTLNTMSRAGRSLAAALLVLAHCSLGLRAGPPDGLFERVVILGASVSASEKAPSPGWILARHLGTPEEKISVFAEGGAGSSRHLGRLDAIAKLRPTLIVALDLFYHDFKFSLFLTQAKKDYLRDYIRRLHDTGAVVVLGNIPGLVLLRYEHANRYLETLLPDFPYLVLIDARTWFDRLNEDGVAVRADGDEVLLRRRDVFADREHINPLGSALVANIILEELRGRFPGRIPVPSEPVELAPYIRP